MSDLGAYTDKVISDDDLGLVRALKKRLGLDILVGKIPQENGAIGAAVLAAKKRSIK